MNILYKPKGPAKEYADDPIMRTEGWAANLYEGCLHGCQYCYVPDTRYWLCKGPDRRKLFHASATPRKDILHKLELDLKRCAGMDEPVFLSFTSDIYQRFVNPEHNITRQALLLCEEYNVKVTILTKGGIAAAIDFNIIERNGWKFGTTLTGGNSQHEPHAAAVNNRLTAIRMAHNHGIYTWVSAEPVLNTENVLDYIAMLGSCVDFWKVGKLNHGNKLGEPYASIEAKTDWGEFLKAVERMIPKEKLLIKHDLEKFRKA